MDEVTEYAFTPEETAVIADYDHSFEALQLQLEGALRMIVGSHALTGNWSRAGMKVVKQVEAKG